MTAHTQGRPGGLQKSPGPPGLTSVDVLVAIGLVPWIGVVVAVGILVLPRGWNQENLIWFGVGSVMACLVLSPLFVPWTRSFWGWSRMPGVLRRAGVVNHLGQPPACTFVLRWRMRTTIRLRSAGHEFRLLETRLGLVADELKLEVLEAEKKGRTFTLRGRRRSAHGGS